MNITEAKELLGDTFRFTVDDTLSVIRGLNLPRDSRILDVGTGKGNLCITLALNGYRVLTGEPEEDQSVYAKQDWVGNARKVGVDHLIDYQAFNAGAMPFDAESFDAVFCLGVLHHINADERSAVMAELARTIVETGLICIFEPNARAIDIIRAEDPEHPDAVDPTAYARGPGLKCRIIEGTWFDAFVFTK